MHVGGSRTAYASICWSSAGIRVTDGTTIRLANVGKSLYRWTIFGLWWRVLNGRTTLGQHQQWLCYIEIGKWYFLFCWRSNKALILSQHQGLHWKNVCISLDEQLRIEVGPKLAFANRKKVYFLHWLYPFGPMLDLLKTNLKIGDLNGQSDWNKDGREIKPLSCSNVPVLNVLHFIWEMKL